MNRHLTRALGAAAACLALAAAGQAGAWAAAPATGSRSAPGPVAGGLATGGLATAPGARLWVKHYNGPGNGLDVASAVAVSPNHKRVFVTGTSAGTGTGAHYATIAYNTATGKRLWVSRYNGPAGGDDSAAAVAVSPNGTAVFVTGTSAGTGTDYATIAYNTATGKRLWVSRYNGPAGGDDSAAAVAVSPNGTAVFVTGASKSGTDPGASREYATVAYDTTTGAQLWASRYGGPHGSIDAWPAAMGVSPHGDIVFVTGSAWMSIFGPDARLNNYYATIAYSATTGARLWARLQSSGGVDSYDYDVAFSMAVSPRGGKLFVAGRGDAMVAYSFAGKRLWARLYATKRYYVTEPQSVAVSPDGRTVFLNGGYSTDGRVTSSHSYETIAYRTANGAQLWARRYAGPGSTRSQAYSVQVGPSGTTVYVTGISGNGYATVAYRAATGALIWSRWYPGGRHAPALAVSGSRVLVACTSGGDYTTIAYQG